MAHNFISLVEIEAATRVLRIGRDLGYDFLGDAVTHGMAASEMLAFAVSAQASAIRALDNTAKSRTGRGRRNG